MMSKTWPYTYLGGKTLQHGCAPYRSYLQMDIPNDYQCKSTFRIDNTLAVFFYLFYNRDKMGIFLNYVPKGHMYKVSS